MDDKPPTTKNYTMGDVGAHSQVVQGDHNYLVEKLGSLPDAAILQQQFLSLLEKVDKEPSLDPDGRELAKGKVKAIANGMGSVSTTPSALHIALLDAKAWFTSSVPWVRTAMSEIFMSDAAQKVIGTITDGPDPCVGRGSGSSGTAHLGRADIRLRHQFPTHCG